MIDPGGSTEHLYTNQLSTGYFVQYLVLHDCDARLVIKSLDQSLTSRGFVFFCLVSDRSLLKLVDTFFGGPKNAFTMLLFSGGTKRIGPDLLCFVDACFPLLMRSAWGGEVISPGFTLFGGEEQAPRHHQRQQVNQNSSNLLSSRW